MYTFTQPFSSSLTLSNTIAPSNIGSDFVDFAKSDPIATKPLLRSNSCRASVVTLTGTEADDFDFVFQSGIAVTFLCNQNLHSSTSLIQVLPRRQTQRTFMVGTVRSLLSSQSPSATHASRAMSTVYQRDPFDGSAAAVNGILKDRGESGPKGLQL